MTGDSAESTETVSRDGRVGECDGCPEETCLALTSDGWRCAECLTPRQLAEVLDLRFRGE